MEKAKVTKLANKISSGDILAFKELFSYYFPKLCLNANDIIYDAEVCKDIVQDLFAQLWEERKRLPEFKDFEGYLFRLNRNKVLDYLKKIKSRNKYESYIINTVNSIYDENDYSNYHELESLISVTIENLPELTQSIYQLNKIESKKQKEVALILGVSLKTVEWHISKLKTELKKNIKNFYLN
jgi:RNA polymerase sigma-70 factor (ECF subfamily)